MTKEYLKRKIKGLCIQISKLKKENKDIRLKACNDKARFIKQLAQCVIDEKGITTKVLDIISDEAMIMKKEYDEIKESRD